MTTTTTVTDAAGRTVHHGDAVGGTTSGRYQTTVMGPVVQIGKDKVKVRVTNRPTYGGYRDANGDDVWIDPSRVFLVHPATERTFTGFRTPDGHTWTVAARTKDVLWESPMVPQRYAANQLRSLYEGKLHPVWQDTPTAEPDAYPLTAPWALLLDDEDLIGFLNELAGVMQDAPHMATAAGHVHARHILDGLHKACATWQLIAEAQHAHTTAPGPDTEATA
ncbi:hypothetical protein [Streptomyces sp. NPDC001068]|uniref:hypothetical protein n=1 Tax=Streptomyces sp. NPDC001068 TaxID=3364544 RepID=UPI0036AC98E5